MPKERNKEMTIIAETDRCDYCDVLIKWLRDELEWNKRIKSEKKGMRRKDWRKATKSENNNLHLK